MGAPLQQRRPVRSVPVLRMVRRALRRFVLVLVATGHLLAVLPVFAAVHHVLGMVGMAVMTRVLLLFAGRAVLSVRGLAVLRRGRLAMLRMPGMRVGGRCRLRQRRLSPK